MAEFLMSPGTTVPAPDDRCYCFSGRQVWLDAEGLPPRRDRLPFPAGRIRRQFSFGREQAPVPPLPREHWALEIDQPAEDGWVDLRECLTRFSEAEFNRIGRASQLVLWDRGHSFCGACGRPTDRLADEFCRQCPDCGQAAYPRLNPAIICLIHKGDQILLARNAKAPAGMFSVIAGYVEAGESLEQTVAREIREEVGLEVDQITYRRSQNWPFPDALMLGFHARWVSGEPTPDGVEILEAAWFDKSNLPLLPRPYSIARHLIRDFFKDETL